MNIGCSDHTKRQWKHQSAQDNYRIALEDTDPDRRRDAVARIAEGGYASNEDAFHVLDVAARTDPVTQIRCIAIRALAAHHDPRAVDVLLTILQAKNKTDQALPADKDVRWEAASGLRALQHKMQLSADQRSASQQLFLDLTAAGEPREVRVVATQALADYQDRQVLPRLIELLHEEDFALADRAEHSLIALTGTTHDYDPEAWTKWIAETPDPFAQAGQVPVTTRPAGPTWWDYQKRAWRRALKLGE